MENCLLGIVEWTYENRVKINNVKTEFIVFASEKQRHKFTSMDIGVDGIKDGTAGDINYVEMWLDNSLTMRKLGSSVQYSFQKFSINEKE